VGWSCYQSISLSVIVCTLPPFQMYASWAITAFFPFAAIVSGWAFSMAGQAFEERRPLYKWGLSSGSVLLMLLALTIYQPAAMFFWVFAAIGLFRRDATLSSVLCCFRWYSVIAFAGLLLGFGVYKLGMAIYGKETLGPTRSSLTSDIWEKVYWFFTQPLLDALNVVNIFPERWPPLLIALFIGSGLLLYFRGEVKERLLQFVIALAIIPLSYLPNLMVAENWGPYRTQAALTSVIVVYAFLASWGYGRILRHPAITLIFTAGLGFAALASGLLAARNVSAYFAVPQSRELELMRAQLTQQNLSQVRGIYIICARWQDSIAPGVRYDEFGIPSSAQSWSPRAMAYLLLREMNLGRTSMPIEVAPADGPVNPPPDTLVVDMHKLLNLQ
jgi:Glucosyl transferase GtrII